jgi:hypothetical protein
MKAELAAPSAGEAIPTPSEQSNADADRRVAVAEFEKAAKDCVMRNGKPVSILGATKDEILAQSTDKIFAAADRLAAWEPK